MHSVNDAETHLKFDINIFNFRLVSTCVCCFYDLLPIGHILYDVRMKRITLTESGQQLDLFNIYVKQFSLISIFIHLSHPICAHSPSFS